MRVYVFDLEQFFARSEQTASNTGPTRGPAPLIDYFRAVSPNLLLPVPPHITAVAWRVVNAHDVDLQRFRNGALVDQRRVSHTGQLIFGLLDTETFTLAASNAYGVAFRSISVRPPAGRHQHRPEEPPVTRPAPLGSPHAILGVKPGASPDEIRRAYRRRVKEAHPDHGGTEQEFIRIQAAYEMLART